MSTGYQIKEQDNLSRTCFGKLYYLTFQVVYWTRQFGIICFCHHVLPYSFNSETENKHRTARINFKYKQYYKL